MARKKNVSFSIRSLHLEGEGENFADALRDAIERSMLAPRIEPKPPKRAAAKRVKARVVKGRVVED